MLEEDSLEGATVEEALATLFATIDGMENISAEEATELKADIQELVGECVVEGLISEDTLIASLLNLNDILIAGSGTKEGELEEASEFLEYVVELSQEETSGSEFTVSVGLARQGVSVRGHDLGGSH